MKETWKREMQENFEPCARAEEMVAYLYGEASQTEARDFERHVQRCASCRAETAAFGDVREAIGEWRQQSLGTLYSPALEANDVIAFASPREASKQRRSAFAALSEFFTLSPVWMRAATVAVALIFCALVVIAIAHFREQAKVVVAENPSTTNVTTKDNNPAVAVKDTSSKETIGNQNKQTAPQEVKVAVNKTPAPKIRHNNIGSQQFAKNRRQQFLPRNGDNPSAELAADYLPFTAPKNEEKLPSLIDLVDEPN
jgi:negative regulator of sigma E activity